MCQAGSRGHAHVWRSNATGDGADRPQRSHSARPGALRPEDTMLPPALGPPDRRARASRMAVSEGANPIVQQLRGGATLDGPTPVRQAATGALPTPKARLAPPRHITSPTSCRRACARPQRCGTLGQAPAPGHYPAAGEDRERPTRSSHTRHMSGRSRAKMATALPPNRPWLWLSPQSSMSRDPPDTMLRRRAQAWPPPSSGPAWGPRSAPASSTVPSTR